MALKELSLTLGVLAGTAGVTNGGYTLYQNFVVIPDTNAEYNLNLMNEVPIVVETVELEPDTKMAMRVEVTVKIYKNGAIMVESGSRRQYIPFKLMGNPVAFNGFPSAALALSKSSFFAAAHAGEPTIIDGVHYNLEIVKYIESMTSTKKNRILRVRIFADGTVESSLIDIRSNQVIDSKTETRALTAEEQKQIESSPYKKKTFKPI